MSDPEAPAVEEMSSIVEEAPPVIEEALPVIEEAPPRVEDASPLVDDVFAPAEEASPADEEGFRGFEDVSPPAPAEEVAPPAVEENAFSDENGEREAFNYEAILDAMYLPPVQMVMPGGRIVPVSSVVMVTVTMPPPRTIHHPLRPRSLEDKARMKQNIIHGHVMLGIQCAQHHNAIIIQHHVSLCNCSRFSRAEIKAIVMETFNHYLLPTEQYFKNTGFPVYPPMTLLAIVNNEIQAYSPHYRNYGTCCLGDMKLSNLLSIRTEVVRHCHPRCMTLGFLFNSPPFAVAVQYDQLPIATALPPLA